jgi:hypothetical protein
MSPKEVSPDTSRLITLMCLAASPCIPVDMQCEKKKTLDYLSFPIIIAIQYSSFSSLKEYISSLWTV